MKMSVTNSLAARSIVMLHSESSCAESALHCYRYAPSNGQNLRHFFRCHVQQISDTAFGDNDNMARCFLIKIVQECQHMIIFVNYR